MTIARGTRLGAYEITGELGVGGMGEVYRATDTKLGREVAIKTLPSGLAQDVDRLARFEREAKLLAALNHAHIAAIYGLDEHDGTRYLAMELIEGQTLEQRLKAGPLPLDEALQLALQIAEALEAAHEKGVVHRDLKPANIMVTRDGVVKVLDFGLAKAFSGDPNAASPLHSPALSLAMTQQGLVLGTAGYMSPEQASAQPTDQRADIWAFGVVLYEMLTGLPPFSGESVPHILAAVLQKEPDWTALPKRLHPRLKVVLERCLEKKVRSRYHSIADVRVEIEKALSDPQGLTAAAAIVPPRSRSWLPAVGGLLAGVVVASVVAWALRPESPQRPATQRLSVTMPADRPLVSYAYPGRPLAISPDGTKLAYIALKAGALTSTPTQLELRSLDSLAVHDVQGAERAFQPFFSPDSRWVGFFTNTGELKKVSVDGGNPITLAEKINGTMWSFGAWTPDGTILFGAPTAGLRRVSAEGGAITDVTQLDSARGEISHSTPTLASSDTVLFTASTSDGRPPRIDAVSLRSGERHTVVENAYDPVVLGDGRLLFQRDESILIAPFDTERLAIAGAAVPLTEAVGRDSPSSEEPVAQLAAAQNGTLAYLPAVATAGELGLVGRDGRFERLGVPPGDYSLPRISPDGHEIAFLESRGQRHTVRVYDLVRGTTTTVAGGDRDAALAWHPDGRSLAVTSFDEASRGLFLRSLDGTQRLLLAPPSDDAFMRAGSWSPDGRHLAYTLQVGGQHDIWVLTMGDEVTTAPFVSTPAPNEYNPQFSPDGRWLAYASDESGRVEVYVARYPEGDQRVVVSTDGGMGPVWGSGGREIFFMALPPPGVTSPLMMAVSVTPEAQGLELGKPVALFPLRTADETGTMKMYDMLGNVGAGYDFLPDRERLLMVRGPDHALSREIVVVQNWK